MRKLVFIIIVVAFSAIYYFSTVKDENSLVSKSISQVNKMVKSSPVFSAAVSEGTQNLQNASNPSEAENINTVMQKIEVTGFAELTTEQFKLWAVNESKRMDSTNNNTPEVEVKMKALAQTLTVEQIQSLRVSALNFQAPSNSQILSAYLVTLNQTPEAQQAMFDIAKSPLPDVGPVLPHSEAEVKHGSELALRYMQIDELFQRAKTDSNAKDKLALLGREAESDQVRNYALRRLKELP